MSRVLDAFRVINNRNVLPLGELQQLHSQHNVNLHSCGEGEDESVEHELDGLSIVNQAELEWDGDGPAPIGAERIAQMTSLGYRVWDCETYEQKFFLAFDPLECVLGLVRTEQEGWALCDSDASYYYPT